MRLILSVWQLFWLCKENCYINTIATFNAPRFELNVLDLDCIMRMFIVGSGGVLVYAPLGPPINQLSIGLMRRSKHDGYRSSILRK